jgi:hypothetical protein
VEENGRAVQLAENADRAVLLVDNIDVTLHSEERVIEVVEHRPQRQEKQT